MRVADIVRPLSEAMQTISKQAAIDGGMFGPVYHGTDETGRASIEKDGFRIGGEDIGNRNGYVGDVNGAAYGPTGIQPPIHHLGYGIYFTTSKAIAKKYNENSTKGIVEYYLDVPRLETINFGSPNTMMNWWQKNGYEMPPLSGRDTFTSHARRIAETKKLTDTLKSQYDAVWFKGKSMRGRLLDGDQIVVFDPRRIHKIDPKLATGIEIGAKVIHNQVLPYTPDYMREYGLSVVDQPDGWRFIIRQMNGREIVMHKIPPPGMKGIVKDIRPIAPQYQEIHRRGMEKAPTKFLAVKWSKGGTEPNYYDTEISPAG